MGGLKIDSNQILRKMKLFNFIAGATFAYRGNGSCGMFESCNGGMLSSADDACCKDVQLCKMYSTKEDFGEKFPNIDCDNLAVHESDKPDTGKPDQKPNSPSVMDKPDSGRPSPHGQPDQLINYEPQNSNVENHITYNTEFETHLNLNFGQEIKDESSIPNDQSAPCHVNLMDAIYHLYDRLELKDPIPMINPDGIGKEELKSFLIEMTKRD